MGYAIRYGYRQEQTIDLGACSLQAAIAVCRDMRQQPEFRSRRMYSAPEIFRPDGIDLDCADGLNQAERDVISESGL